MVQRQRANSEWLIVRNESDCSDDALSVKLVQLSGTSNNVRQASESRLEQYSLQATIQILLHHIIQVLDLSEFGLLRWNARLLELFNRR